MLLLYIIAFLPIFQCASTTLLHTIVKRQSLGGDSSCETECLRGLDVVMKELGGAGNQNVSIRSNGVVSRRTFQILCGAHEETKACISGCGSSGNGILSKLIAYMDTVCTDKAQELEVYLRCFETVPSRLKKDCDSSCGTGQAVAAAFLQSIDFHDTSITSYLSQICTVSTCQLRCTQAAILESCPEDAEAAIVISDFLVLNGFRLIQESFASALSPQLWPQQCVVEKQNFGNGREVVETGKETCMESCGRTVQEDVSGILGFENLLAGDMLDANFLGAHLLDTFCGLSNDWDRCFRNCGPMVGSLLARLPLDMVNVVCRDYFRELRVHFPCYEKAMGAIKEKCEPKCGGAIDLAKSLISPAALDLEELSSTAPDVCESAACLSGCAWGVLKGSCPDPGADLMLSVFKRTAEILEQSLSQSLRSWPQSCQKLKDLVSSDLESEPAVKETDVTPEPDEFETTTEADDFGEEETEEESTAETIETQTDPTIDAERREATTPQGEETTEFAGDIEGDEFSAEIPTTEGYDDRTGTNEIGSQETSEGITTGEETEETDFDVTNEEGSSEQLVSGGFRGSANNCPDSDPRCPRWAKLGMCESHPIWLKAHCQNACNCCGCTEASVRYGLKFGNKVCADQRSECATWAATEECTKNYRYMEVFCRKSCNLCS